MSVKDSWISFSDSCLRAIFPPKCSLCEILSENNPCHLCLAELGEPAIALEEFHDGILDYCAWLYPYEGRSGQAVRHLKYRRSTALTDWMASEIHRGFSLLPTNVDGIVPVPIHWSRRAQRGFNQSELLSERLDVDPDFVRSLLRVKATRSQAGLNQEQRLRNLIGAFRAAPANVEGKQLLLIDDVMTTGHTLRMCAKELKEAGASVVGALVFARTIGQPPNNASAT